MAGIGEQGQSGAGTEIGAEGTACAAAPLAELIEHGDTEPATARGDRRTTDGSPHRADADFRAVLVDHVDTDGDRATLCDIGGALLVTVHHQNDRDHRYSALVPSGVLDALRDHLIVERPPNLAQVITDRYGPLTRALLADQVRRATEDHCRCAEDPCARSRAAAAVDAALELLGDT